MDGYYGPRLPPVSGHGLPGGRRDFSPSDFELRGWPSRSPMQHWDDYSLDELETPVSDIDDDDGWFRYMPRRPSPYSRRRRRYGPRLKYPMDDLDLLSPYPDDYYTGLPLGPIDDFDIDYYPVPGPFGGRLGPGRPPWDPYGRRPPRGPGGGPPGLPYYDVYHHHDHVHFHDHNHDHNHRHHHGHHHRHEHIYHQAPFGLMPFVVPAGCIPRRRWRYPYAAPMDVPLNAAYGYGNFPPNYLPAQGPYGPPLPRPMRRGGLARLR